MLVEEALDAALGGLLEFLLHDLDGLDLAVGRHLLIERPQVLHHYLLQFVAVDVLCAG